LWELALFFDSRRKPTVAFDVPRPMEVQVELANADTGEVVHAWTVEAAPGVPNAVTWGGLGPRGVEPVGSYGFPSWDRQAAGDTGARNGERLLVRRPPVPDPRPAQPRLHR
jgi:hypothetical protein